MSFVPRPFNIWYFLTSLIWISTFPLDPSGSIVWLGNHWDANKDDTKTTIIAGKKSILRVKVQFVYNSDNGLHMYLSTASGLIINLVEINQELLKFHLDSRATWKISKCRFFGDILNSFNWVTQIGPKIPKKFFLKISQKRRTLRSFKILAF